MRNTFKGGIATVLALAMAATTLLPVQATAMPLAKPGIAQSSDAVEVQYRREHRRHGWHNGHRGHRHERRGYRRHSDGWWYPLAAFGAGAIIGGAIANDGYARRPREAGINPRHVEWCQMRYRSYRSYDNTFQPYGGPRQQCYSPYF